jgi:chromosome segregation ATPase
MQSFKSHNKTLKANTESLDKEVGSLQSDLQAIKSAATESSSTSRKSLDALLETKKKVLEEIETVWKQRDTDADKALHVAAEALGSKKQEIATERELEREKIEHLKRYAKMSAEARTIAQDSVEEVVAEITAMTGSCTLIKETLIALVADLADLDDKSRLLLKDGTTAAGEVSKLVAEQSDLDKQAADTVSSTVKAEENLGAFKTDTIAKEQQLQERLVQTHRQLEQTVADNDLARDQLAGHRNRVAESTTLLAEAKGNQHKVELQICNALQEKRDLLLSIGRCRTELQLLGDRRVQLLDLGLVIRQLVHPEMQPEDSERDVKVNLKKLVDHVDEAVCSVDVAARPY